TKGTLVRINGRDSGTGLPTVAKSKATGTSPTLATLAEYIVILDTPDVTSGNLAERYVITGLDTSGQASGALVYASGTAGNFQFTAINTANEDSDDRNIRQVVGRVLAVDVSVGSIEFNIDPEDLLLNPRLSGFTLSPSSSVSAGSNITFDARVKDKYGVNISGRYYGEVSFMVGSAANEFDDNVGSAQVNLTATLNIGTRLGLHVANGLSKFYTNSTGTVQFILSSSSAQSVWVRCHVGSSGPKTGFGTWT
ncbi:hypothetical protein LCGC14_3147460, partial [marine sediment metagenome]